MLNKYPKIFNLGRVETEGVFEGRCDILEKVDGSQLRWRVDIETKTLLVGSKGQRIDTNDPPKLFKKSVESLLKINIDRFDWNVVYFGEAFSKPKHNKIQYGRVPDGNIMLWAAYDTSVRRWFNHNELMMDASIFNIECVGLVDIVDRAPTPEQLEKYMKVGSALGGSNVEGVVIKNHWNYKVEQDMALCKQAKFVSQEFRETMGVKINKTSDIRDIVLMLKEEAIWHKAIQRVKESANEPMTDRHIGQVVREVHNDIDNEFKPLILEELWKMHSKNIKRLACKGVADYFKRQMALTQLEED